MNISSVEREKISPSNTVSTTIVGKSINEVVLNAYRQALISPKKDSRNGSTRSIQNLNLIITDPSQRWLSLEGRKSNPFAMLAETLWVLSGSDKIRPYLEFYLPRAADFSDDNATWRGAYAPRIFSKDALQGAVEILEKDLLSRRAVLTIYDNNLDSPLALQEQGLNSSRDIPCNNWIHFYVTEEIEQVVDSVTQEQKEVALQKLNMKVVSRSGDLIWGLGSINIFEWTFLQEIVWEILKRTHPDLLLGIYYHSTTDAHIYESNDGTGLNTASQARTVVENYNNTPILDLDTIPMNTGFVSINHMRNFCSDIVGATSSFIVGEIDSLGYEEFVSHKLKDIRGTFFATMIQSLMIHTICKKDDSKVTVTIDPELAFWKSIEMFAGKKFSVMYK